MKSVLTTARNAFRFVVNMPIYWLSLVFPRDQRVWIFGAWFGYRYADNTKRLFEAAQDIPGIRAIWLSRDPEVVAAVRKLGFESRLAYSPGGYVASLRASAGFIVTSKWDLNRFCHVPNLFNLWHGTPIKKIMADDDLHWREPPRMLKRVFPYVGANPGGHLFVSSETEAAVFKSAFQTTSELIHVTGSPRNDALGRPYQVSERGGRVLLYAPTHRNEGGGWSLRELAANLAVVNGALEEMDATLVVRAHFYEKSGLDLTGFSRVVTYQESGLDPDLYVGLQSVDVLITDYSSVYLDFLLTGRPIVFFPYDLEDYLSDDRGLYFPYGDITPGPKVYTWMEALSSGRQFLENPQMWASERAAVRDRFHQYRDSGATARVLAIALATISHGAPSAH